MLERSLHVVGEQLGASGVDAAIKERFEKFSGDFNTWKGCQWVVQSGKEWVLERIFVRVDRGSLYVLQEFESSRRQIAISTLGSCEANDRDRRFSLVKSGEFRSSQCAIVGSRGVEHPDFENVLPLCLVFESQSERNTFVVGFKVVLWYLDGARVDAVARNTQEFGALVDVSEEDEHKVIGNMQDLDTVDPIPDDLTYFLLRAVEDERRVHRLRAVTFVGRSGRRLRPGIDLIIGNKEDVSRIHARFEVSGEVPALASIRVFDEGSFGGTFVDGQAVDAKGQLAFVGSSVKFGQDSIFVVEFNRSLLSAAVAKTSRHVAEPDTAEILVKDVHTLGALRRCRLFVELDALVHELIADSQQHRLLLRISVLDGPSGSPLAPPVTNTMADRLLMETLQYLRLGAVLKVTFESAAQSVLLVNSHGRMI